MIVLAPQAGQADFDCLSDSGTAAAVSKSCKCSGLQVQGSNTMRLHFVSLQAVQML